VVWWLQAHLTVRWPEHMLTVLVLLGRDAVSLLVDFLLVMGGRYTLFGVGG
jgi:hypothetical protein